MPERKVLYQFSARGHELAQILLGLQLTDAHDGVRCYYRSRPLMLALGVSLEEAAAGPLAAQRLLQRRPRHRCGLQSSRVAAARPCCRRAVASARSTRRPRAGHRRSATATRRSPMPAYARSIAVVLGGDASTATNGFWSALNIATTLQLPMLFFIEDNGFGISVPARLQTPGGNIAANLRSFAGLAILEGDGSDPRAAATLTAAGGRAGARRRVPRCCCGSRCRACRVTPGQDTQAYKSPQTAQRGACPRSARGGCRNSWCPRLMPRGGMGAPGERGATARSRSAIAQALARSQPDPRELTHHVFCERRDGNASCRSRAGLRRRGIVFAALERRGAAAKARASTC